MWKKVCKNLLSAKMCSKLRREKNLFKKIIGQRSFLSMKMGKKIGEKRSIWSWIYFSKKIWQKKLFKEILVQKALWSQKIFWGGLFFNSRRGHEENDENWTKMVLNRPKTPIVRGVHQRGLLACGCGAKETSVWPKYGWE